jgi:prepilin-type N-terminal cleavage/methylation domain-containing protein
VRYPTELGGSGNDRGFTLVELIIAILIIGVITVPLANIVIAYLDSTDTTTARLLESHDAQMASAYWAQDVASIGTRSTTNPYPLTQSVETGVTFGSSRFPCGTAGTTPVVTLAWDDFTGPGASTLDRVAYVVEQSTELHRLRCNGSAAVVSDVTVAHDLSATTAPKVTCSTSCSGAPAVPTKLTLTLTLTDPTSTDGPYVVALTGQRRQS